MRGLPAVVASLAFALSSPATLAQSTQAHGDHARMPSASPETTDSEKGPSGASVPDPMEMMDRMKATERWTGMLHGFLFLNENRQGGPSGVRSFESQNHLMAMALRTWAGGKLSVSGTFSLEPATIPAKGSPELFQRGETYQSVLLIDRQHQHDLFVQLAVAWEKALSDTCELRVYIAPRGEPALGPVAFPHRLSASENPSAPLSHHNQDATHIANDVASIGLKASIFTIEGSVFRGREPDENRWDLEQGMPDSYSGRLWIRPTPELAFQVSVGKLEHPEVVEDGDQTRSTASVSYQRVVGEGFLAVTAAVGRNQTDEGTEWGNTLEWTWKFARSNFLYGRVESVDRDVYELIHKRQRPEGEPHQKTRVQAATFGYVRNIALLGKAEAGLGVDVTMYRFDSRLEAVYGSHPVSLHAFLRVRFSSGMGGHEGMSHSGM